jgi:hypothetical protein
MPAIDIGLGFGAALQKVEERLVEYVANAYRRAADRPLTAFALARHIEHLVGLKGLYLNPGMLLGWVQTFEERTGRMILEKIADTRPQQYRFVYDKNVAYPGENRGRTKG